jgi:hypothetical protein
MQLATGALHTLPLAMHCMHAGWEPVLCTRSELGFQGSTLYATISRHNPLFPPSPTATTPRGDAPSSTLDCSDASPAMLAAPEPYRASATVEMPATIPSMMSLIVHLLFEVRTDKQMLIVSYLPLEASALLPCQRSCNVSAALGTRQLPACVALPPSCMRCCAALACRTCCASCCNGLALHGVSRERCH